MTSEITRFTKDNIPPMDSEAWEWFQKKEPTRMVECDGPFEIETQEGVLHVPEGWHGWVAVDTSGHPYPITAEEQSSTYRRI